MIDVIIFQFEALFVTLIAATIDCPPAGETWFNRFVKFFIAMMFFDFAWNEGTWANDR